ncbi:hypothetical protein [Erythrobacter phage vB_EliS-L02]|nr:hypothetical protein [Erythrobacter phage vB_EliS-L02]
MKAALGYIPLNDKEAEALMWGLAQVGDNIDREVTDRTDPLYGLLALGYTRPMIAKVVESLWEVAYGHKLEGGWTELEKAILKACVESTSWINVYRTHPPTNTSPPHIAQALEALRTLAAKLDEFGVEVNFIAFD